jgi:hypothetical protein
VPTAATPQSSTIDDTAIINRMSKQQRPRTTGKIGTRKPQLVMADVPVKISILHDAEALKEYEEVIPVEFDPKTQEGNQNASQLHQFMKQGLSTESALFEIARAQAKQAAHDIVCNLTPELRMRLAGQSLHFHIKRNGEITYRGFVVSNLTCHISSDGTGRDLRHVAAKIFGDISLASHLTKHWKISAAATT